jgi:hypothetical protein
LSASEAGSAGQIGGEEPLEAFQRSPACRRRPGP